MKRDTDRPIFLRSGGVIGRTSDATEEREKVERRNFLSLVDGISNRIRQETSLKSSNCTPIKFCPQDLLVGRSFRFIDLTNVPLLIGFNSFNKTRIRYSLSAQEDEVCMWAIYFFSFRYNIPFKPPECNERPIK